MSFNMRTAKKTLAILLAMLVASCAFAGDWSFLPINVDPLHKQYAADSWNFDTRGQVIHLLDGADLSQVLLCTRYEVGREDQYLNFENIQTPIVEEFVHEIANFRDDDEPGVDNLLRVKTGFGFGILRTTYKDFSFEFDVQGAINVVFDAEYGTDCLGFDGIYFYGINISYGDLVTARIGRHHHSGHYGDEIEEDFLLKTDELGRNYADRFAYDRNKGGYVSMLTQYVRQDSLVAGVSATPLDWLRVYAEIDIPTTRMLSIRPWVLIPNGTINTDDGTKISMDALKGYLEGIYGDLNGERKFKYDDSYKDIAFNFGAEFSLQCGNVGTLMLAYDIKLSQEGQTMYQIGAYSKDNPWDVDHNVLLSFEFTDMPVTAEFIYHNGRLPLMNYYWYHCSYISAGFSVRI